MKGGRDIGKAKENLKETGKNLTILPTEATKGVTNIALNTLENTLNLADKTSKSTLALADTGVDAAKDIGITAIGTAGLLGKTTIDKTGLLGKTTIDVSSDVGEKAVTVSGLAATKGLEGLEGSIKGLSRVGTMSGKNLSGVLKRQEIRDDYGRERKLHKSEEESKRKNASSSFKVNPVNFIVSS